MARRRLEVEIVGDAKRLERELGRAESRIAAFGRDVNKKTAGAGTALFGRTGAAFAGGLVGAEALRQVRVAVDAASNLQEQINKTGVVFGQSSREVHEWAQSTADNLGIAEDRALEAAGTFGNLTRAMGLSEAESSGLARSMVELAADLASFNNASPEDTLLALRSAIVGEYEPLRRYGSALSEARVQQEALTRTGKASVRELTNQEKVTARYALIMKDTSLAQGDFARTSGGLANSQRILAARARDLQTELGKLAMPVLSDLVSVLSDATGGALALADAFRDLGKLDLGPLGKAVDILKFTPLNPLGFVERGRFVAEKLGVGGKETPVVDTTRIESVLKSSLDRLTSTATAAKPKSVVTGQFVPPSGDLPLNLQNAILRAENTNDRGALLKALRDARAFIEGELTRSTVTPEIENKLRSNLEAVQNGIQSIFASRNSELAAAAADAKAAKARMEAEADKRRADAKTAAEEAQRLLGEVPVGLQAEILTAQNANDRRAEARALIKARNLLQSRLGKKGVQPETANEIRQNIETLQSAIQSVFASLNKTTKGAADAAEDVSRKADEFRSKALAALDRKQSALDTSRALEDARRALTRARQIGDPFGVKLAQRDLEDARLGRQRFLLEKATFERNPKGGFNIQGSTFHFHGVQNIPELLEALRRVSAGGPAQTRGRHAGRRIGP